MQNIPNLSANIIKGTLGKEIAKNVEKETLVELGEIKPQEKHFDKTNTQIFYGNVEKTEKNINNEIEKSIQKLTEEFEKDYSNSFEEIKELQDKFNIIENDRVRLMKSDKFDPDFLDKDKLKAIAKDKSKLTDDEKKFRDKYSDYVNSIFKSVKNVKYEDKLPLKASIDEIKSKFPPGSPLTADEYREILEKSAGQTRKSVYANYPELSIDNRIFTAHNLLLQDMNKKIVKIIEDLKPNDEKARILQNKSLAELVRNQNVLKNEFSELKKGINGGLTTFQFYENAFYNLRDFVNDLAKPQNLLLFITSTGTLALGATSIYSIASNNEKNKKEDKKEEEKNKKEDKKEEDKNKKN